MCLELMEKSNIATDLLDSAHVYQTLEACVATNVLRTTGRLPAVKAAKLVIAMILELVVSSAIR